MNTSRGSDALEAEETQENAETAVEEGGTMGAVSPPSSPVQMTELDTATFCLMYRIFLCTKE